MRQSLPLMPEPPNRNNSPLVTRNGMAGQHEVPVQLAYGLGKWARRVVSCSDLLLLEGEELGSNILQCSQE